MWPNNFQILHFISFCPRNLKWISLIPRKQKPNPMKRIPTYPGALTLFFAALLSSSTAIPLSASAQENVSSEEMIVIAPLFEYPMAPEEISDLTGKSNWLLEHFWDKFDFKSKKAVDQNALNHAFSVYAGPMRWGDKDVVYKSTDRLLENLSRNPVMLLQMVKAAEENLYGPRAEAYIDEIYVRFLHALMKNKKISSDRKARYSRQLRILENSMLGSVPPDFEFTTPSGAKEKFRPGLLTVIEFGDPDCTDCAYAKIKMNSDVAFSGAVEKGKINVLFIYPDPEEGWEDALKSYPSLWHVGASDTVSDIYDIRETPYFFVIDTDGKIVLKTSSVQAAMASALQNVK